MESELKKKLRTLSLALRHTLERDGDKPGDLHLRLNEIGVRPDRPPMPVQELVLTDADRAARATVDAFLAYREAAGVPLDVAFREFVRESAYSWANRLFTLRCLEARGLIDPAVILQQKVYGGRSLAHHRFARENPAACTGEDGGLFAVLSLEFARRARELPAVFDPGAPAIALRPSVPALKRCIALLSGEDEEDTLFQAADTLGWAYQFWNAEEKDRVFERVRTEKSAKIEGADLIPATQLYTEPYMVKFLVQNSLGALWAGMYPDSSLHAQWEYYVRDADRTPPVHPDPPPFDPRRPPQPGADPWVRPNPNLRPDPDVIAYAHTLVAKVPNAENGSFAGLRNEMLDAAAERAPEKLLDLNRRICEAWGAEWPARRPKLRKRAGEISFLDPACGSGHFLLEAFDLLYEMHHEEDPDRTPDEICASILNRNLYGIDIDERAIQIAHAALWMHARERSPELQPEAVTALADHLVAANLALPKGESHLEKFLAKHPDDVPLASALRAVFDGLADADQLGSLVRIEEPVEQELQRRKAEEDLRVAQVLRQAQGNLEFASEQYVLEEAAPKRDYEAWKHEVLERLKTHFRQEAEVSDALQSFFGRDARRGLALFDLLARRYDVVAANPPYMGSKNMGPVLNNYCRAHYSAGKRDLYAVFIERCRQLARWDGYVAMVAQQSWMFMRSFTELREAILRQTLIESLAHLGSGGFGEISGEIVNTTLFCIRTSQPSSTQRLAAFRLIGPRSPDEKATLLRQALRSSISTVVYRPSQTRFLSIPQAPVCYWLRPRFLDLLTGKKLSEVADVCQGLATANDPRFVRFHWEVDPVLWKLPVTCRRWVPYEKGGGYGKWFGHQFWVVDWEAAGNRLKRITTERYGNAGKRIINEDRFFSAGWTYSCVARGSLGFRALTGEEVLCDKSPGVFRRSEFPDLPVHLNSRFASFTARALAQRIDIRESYVSAIPFIPSCSSDLASAVEECVELKKTLICGDLTERCFRSPDLTGSMREALDNQLQEAVRIGSRLHTIEGACELKVASIYELDDADIASMVDETGLPAGWNALFAGYDQPLDGEQLVHSRVVLNEADIDSLKRKLRVMYTNGPGFQQVEEGDVEEDADEDEVPANGGSIPIPSETFAEEIAQKLQIHPVSVYWLLQEMRREEGLVCPPEIRRLAEDHVSMLVLRMLGHQWPKEVEAGTALPLWVGIQGIIPITDSLPSKTSLLRRVSERLSEAFEASSVVEFERLTSVQLARWLEREFYLRHIRQFRNRPIAWQVQTRPVGRGTSPVLSCLLYYHRIAAVLPDLRKLYVGVLRSNYESELLSLDLVPSLTGDQKDRKAKLELWIEELREFQEALERIEADGFATGKLRSYAIDDAVLSVARRWLGRLRDAIRQGPLAEWREQATGADYPAQLPSWISVAVDRVDRQCVAVAPASPPPETPDSELTANAIAELLRGAEEAMVRRGLQAICRDWQAEYDKAVVQPLKDEIKAANDLLEALPDTIENKLRRKDLKLRVKELKKEIVERAAKSRELGQRIEEWRCPEAETWLDWLTTQPLYDEVSSLDGKRQPPETVAEFVAQESQYQPDLNDGVRVNIAPLQKAGVLARDVLAAKDVDKAIADRAEWRADERRWVRQGVLPRPGWWPAPQERARQAEGGR